MIYFPYSKSGSYGSVVASGSYQDLKADFDSDGKIDYWLLEKNDLKIEQRFQKGVLTDLYISRTLDNSIQEILYQGVGGSLKLLGAGERRLRSFGFSNNLISDKKLDVCNTQKSVFEEIGKLGAEFNRKGLFTNIQEAGIVDETCVGEKAVIAESQFNNLARGISEAVNMTPTNKFADCLNSPDTLAILAKGADEKQKQWMAEELKLLGLKYKLYAARFYKDPTALKGKFTCKEGPPQSPVAQSIENKNIVLYKKDDVKTSEYAKVITHEIMHDIGLTNEEVTKATIDICVSGRTKVTSKLVGVSDKNKNYSVFFAGGNAAVATKKQAAATPAKVPKQLAETAVKNPPVAQINQPFTDSKQAVVAVAQTPEVAATEALSRSVTQSRGVFGTANTLLNAFGSSVVPKAVAADISAVSGAGGSVSSGSSRSIGSSGSFVSGSRRSRGQKSNGDDDYRVTEEILVSDPSLKKQVSRQLSTRSSSSADRDPSSSSPSASSSFASSGNSSGASNGGSSETASNGGSAFNRGSGPTSGGGGGGRRGGRVESSGSGGRRASAPAVAAKAKGPSRAPASLDSKKDVDTSTPSSIVTMSRKEIVSVFTTRRRYNDLKKQIARDDVQRKLKINSISILDTEGNVLGAPKGQIIFLDSGDAFVRQK